MSGKGIEEWSNFILKFSGKSCIGWILSFYKDYQKSQVTIW